VVEDFLWPANLVIVGSVFARLSHRCRWPSCAALAAAVPPTPISRGR
jgi:hypothetical protein